MLIMLATYLINELFELINGMITHIRWRAKAEKELSELSFRISELEKKVLGGSDD